jgi:hypothetical protein
MKFKELTEGYYDMEDDDYTRYDIDDITRPRLTLMHLGKLRRMREMKKYEESERQKFFKFIYGKKPEE